MPDVNVTYEEMESVAQQLTAGYEDISGKLSQLKGRVGNLAGSGFVTDVSSRKFRGAYLEFNSGVTQTLQGLEEMSKYLIAKASQFREIDAG